jgi:hypothetical protein
MLQTDVLLVLLDSGLNGMAGLPIVNLAWSLEFQVVLHRLKETGNHPWWEVSRLDVPG